MLQAQTDGTQYPITDPRNPNCPCHQHQKKADEEYRKLLQNQYDNEEIIVAQQTQNINVQPLAQNQFINQPLPQHNINAMPEVPQIALPALNKPDIKFSIHVAKPALGGYSGVTVKHKKHSVKKLSFKTSRKLKKIFHHKKKIRVKHANCFEW